jgi:hypothetical protein
MLANKSHSSLRHQPAFAKRNGAVSVKRAHNCRVEATEMAPAAELHQAYLVEVQASDPFSFPSIGRLKAILQSACPLKYWAVIQQAGSATGHCKSANRANRNVAGNSAQTNLMQKGRQVQVGEKICGHCQVVGRVS